MGDDNPLAVLSNQPHMLYTYFKQRFAQVWSRTLCMTFTACTYLFSAPDSNVRCRRRHSHRSSCCTRRPSNRICALWWIGSHACGCHLLFVFDFGVRVML